MSSVMVFSHPNHEISVLGTISRKAPQVIFLTDGGGEERVRETIRGLSSYLPSDSLHFLARSEQSLYQALVKHDTQFYRQLAGEVGEIIERVDPREIYCDAIEFYNPVHDMALPVVRAALRGRDDVVVFEVPLIYQKASESVSFTLQQVPSSLEHLAVTVSLTEEELEKKMAILRGRIYDALFSQLGPLISEAIPARAHREQYITARKKLPKPEPDQVLRYDMRGRTLKTSGDVREAITYRGHYVPMFESLCPD